MAIETTPESIRVEPRLGIDEAAIGCANAAAVAGEAPAYHDATAILGVAEGRVRRPIGVGAGIVDHPFVGIAAHVAYTLRSGPLWS